MNSSTEAQRQPQARAPKTHPTHHSHNLDGIHARHIAIQALPPRDPALRRVRQRDEALVHLRRTFLDRVRGVGQAEEVFAVGAAFFEEALDFPGAGLVGDRLGFEGAEEGRLTECSWMMEQTMQARRLRAWLVGTKLGLVIVGRVDWVGLVWWLAGW